MKGIHDEREHINIVLIGHVDAGKSTTAGRILLDTNQIDERIIAKYAREAKDNNRESWWIAYIMDQDVEERARGKTVECGRAHFETEKKRYTILDAPGHKNYVPNMISGAGQADIALLVVSARTGEFESGFDKQGQTREHALLAKTLGIQRIVIVVNKMDEIKWDKKRYDEIDSSVKKFLFNELSFKDKNIESVPVSSQTGANVVKPMDAQVCSWYNGPSLVGTLDAMKRLKRGIEKPLRISILDRYKGDKGLQAIGKVEYGCVAIGDTVVCMPTNTKCVVSNLAIDDTEVVDKACAGENVLVTFDTQKTNISLDNIYSGCILCPVDNPSPYVTKFKAEILVCEVPQNILANGYSTVFHCHNLSTTIEITTILHLVNKKDGRLSKKPPQYLRNKDSAIVIITITGQPIACEKYDDFPQFARFTLRDQQKTAVMGRILEFL